MTISGYDPDDVDEALERRLEEREVSEYLSDEERSRWEAGESLVDLLDEADIDRLLSSAPGDPD